MGNTLDESEFEAMGGSVYKWDLRNRNGVKVTNGTYILVAKFIDANGKREIFKRVIGVKM